MSYPDTRISNPFLTISFRDRWDMEKGTMFIAVAMPWQSGDALESTSGLTQETLLSARADREQIIQDLAASGRMRLEDAIARFPPIEHL